MPIPIYQVDAFSSAPFSGNPAGVCLLDEAVSEEWMQSAAAEMNLAETAFLFPEVDSQHGECYRLRWFTPRVEVDLCGHATLASAHVLWSTGRLPPAREVKFLTKSGLLTTRVNGDEIEMDFPAEPAAPADVNAVLEALGLEQESSRFAGRNRFDALVEIDETMLKQVDPDFRRLAQLPFRGAIVTARSTDLAYDFVSRFFAPAAGIDEDPVTGSAHCCLAPYWSAKLGKQRLVGFQASRRGGVVTVDHRQSRVSLIGRAITVIAGEWASCAEPRG